MVADRGLQRQGRGCRKAPFIEQRLLGAPSRRTLPAYSRTRTGIRVLEYGGRGAGHRPGDAVFPHRQHRARLTRTGSAVVTDLAGAAPPALVGFIVVPRSFPLATTSSVEYLLPGVSTRWASASSGQQSRRGNSQSPVATLAGRSVIASLKPSAKPAPGW